MTTSALNPLAHLTSSTPSNTQGAAPHPGASTPAEGNRVQEERQAFARRCSLVQIEHDPLTGFQAYSDGGRVIAIFGGKRTKPDAYERHASPEKALERVAKAQVMLREAAARKAVQRAAEAAQASPLRIDDVLMASWGYEQTNIDYYQVVATRGKRTVTLRKIARQSQVDGFEQGQCVPAVGRFIGEAFERRANSRGSVAIDSVATAYPLEYVEAGGMRIYKAERWTSYY